MHDFVTHSVYETANVFLMADSKIIGLRFAQWPFFNQAFGVVLRFLD